jgi:hypothetical protein
MISLLLISEFFPALSDSDMGLPEINMASYTLGKAEEHSILATSKILFCCTDFRLAKISFNLL